MSINNLPIQKIDKHVKEWFKSKTIERIKVLRPTKQERKMYRGLLGPASLKFYFTDGTSVILDSWVGEFLLKPCKITGVKNTRLRSYLTVSRKEV